jgi:predicted TIM-barrel fold metal-dependent hydrolase
LAVIDADVHPSPSPSDPNVAKYFSERSRRYMALRGIPVNDPVTMQIPRQRSQAHRLDAMPPMGVAGGDPDFARAQTLDEFGMTAGILNSMGGLRGWGSNNPLWLTYDAVRGANDWLRELWLEADERWYGAIATAPEQAEWSAQEIARAAESHERFVQVILPSRTDYPIGSPRYWPIFEAAEDLGLTVGLHVGASLTSLKTGSGAPSYYVEDHAGFVFQGFSVVPSLIYNGVFDRFPKLRIVFTEMGWTWVAPFSWRLDASWRVLKDEVPELERLPSEYLREHCWFTTQPITEPERPEWLERLYAQLERAGFGSRLLFSSDYPHWDFDSPDEAIPPWLPEETRARIFAGNASELWNIPLP